MSNLINFTVISGSSNTEALCYLLEMDQIKILLDCGGLDYHLNWLKNLNLKGLQKTAAEFGGNLDLEPTIDIFDEVGFNKLINGEGGDENNGESVEEPEGYKMLKEVLPKVNIILLSHGTLSHIGAYVFAHKFFNLNCPVYCTIPVQNLGRLTCMDLIQNWNYFLNYQVITPNDVNLAFNNIKSLRYLQTEKLEGILAGISITPYSAGHTIGGTIWRILKDSDNIMYIPDINHKKERLLNGSGILHQGIVMENFERPTLLITGASQPLGNTKTSKNIDDELLNSFKSTLSEGGKVIIPVEVGGRMLEMACTLEELWQEHRLDYPIYILSHHSLKLIQYAQSMLEWLNSRLSELFSHNRENPLNFKHVKPINGWEDWCTLMKVQKNNPMVVLCSGETIQDGEMSFHLMKDWGLDEKNLLLLTNREALSQDHNDTLISQVFAELKKSYLSQENNEGEYSWIMGPLQVNVDADIKFTEPELLEGNELEEYVNKERELRSQRLQKDAMIAHNKRILDGTMDDEDDDDDEDEQPVNVTVDADGNTIKRLHHGTNQPQMDRGSLLNYQYDLMVADDMFNSASNPLNPTIIMYPSGTSNFESRKRKFDDYGEVISILQYSNELSLKLNGEGNQNEDGDNEDDEAINPEGAQDLEVKKVERPPCKFLQKIQKISFICKVQFIEFQGRADSRSLRNILEGLKPKKMIIIHGSQQTIEDLKKPLDDKVEIFIPVEGITIPVSAATHIYPVKLDPSLMHTWSLQNSREWELGRVRGILKYEEQMPLLTTLPPDLKLLNQAPMMVGEVKFNELKEYFGRNKFKGEFRDQGELVVNKKVKLKKVKGDKIVMSGKLTSDFFQVRDLIYQKYPVL